MSKERSPRALCSMTMGTRGMAVSCALECNQLVAHSSATERLHVQEASMLDSIVREVTLPVGPDEAWEAITEPEHLEAWFADEVEALEPVPGGEVAVRFDDAGPRRGVVEEVEEGRRLAFRWSDQGETRVEFTLEEVPEG